jgi:hypothetical protein
VVHSSSHTSPLGVKPSTLNLAALAALSVREKRHLAAEALVAPGTIDRILSGRGRAASVTRLIEAAQRLGLLEVLT